MKQVIIIRKDLGMSKGKCAVQAAHAAVEATVKSLKRNPKKVESWMREGMKKVVLGVKTKEELLELKKLAEQHGLITSLIQDAGKTEVPPGSETALAIGPDEEEAIDEITGDLKPL